MSTVLLLLSKKNAVTLDVPDSVDFNPYKHSHTSALKHVGLWTMDNIGGS